MSGISKQTLRKTAVSLVPVLFLGVVTFQSRAWAFPENIRHNYVNCNSCHFSPTGGGLVTEYGRNLSREVMSTWSKEGEQNAFYGAMPSSKTFFLGGDLRAVQVYSDTPRNTNFMFIPMQLDLETAFRQDKFTLAATLGIDKNPVLGETSKGLSRRFYAAYDFRENWSIRVGRFFPAYGLNIPEHTFWIKRYLGFDENMESYNAEVSYLGEDTNLFMSLIDGRPDDLTLNRETGAAIIFSKNFLDRHKVSLSFLNGNTASRTRNALGISAVLGFTSQIYLLTEVDVQVSQIPGAGVSTQGIFSFLKFGYEWFQGFHTCFVQETALTDTNQPQNQQSDYGLSVQWFPRPHFDFEGFIAKTKTPLAFPDAYTTGWLMGHYYF